MCVPNCSNTNFVHLPRIRDCITFAIALMLPFFVSWQFSYSITYCLFKAKLEKRLSKFLSMPFTGNFGIATDSKWTLLTHQIFMNLQNVNTIRAYTIMERFCNFIEPALLIQTVVWWLGTYRNAILNLRWTSSLCLQEARSWVNVKICRQAANIWSWNCVSVFAHTVIHPLMSKTPRLNTCYGNCSTFLLPQS